MIRDTVGMGSSRKDIVGVLLEVEGLNGNLEVLLECPVCSLGSVTAALYASRVTVGIARSSAKPPECISGSRFGAESKYCHYRVQFVTVYEAVVEAAEIFRAAGNLVSCTGAGSLERMA